MTRITEGTWGRWGAGPEEAGNQTARGGEAEGTCQKAHVEV